jgi:hypothetical protein
MNTATTPGTTEREPRVVGGRYRSYYWGIEYTVLAVSRTESGALESITVTDTDGTRTHATAWDGRDQILCDPRTTRPQP